LVAGSKLLQSSLQGIFDACYAFEDASNRFDAKKNLLLASSIREAVRVGTPTNYIARVLQLAKQGFRGIEFDTYNTSWTSEAYRTVGGQNSNNSVRVPNDFFRLIDGNGEWQLIRRTDAEVERTIPARDLWNDIAFNAWACADPGLQFDTTINEWHTCPEDGRINASNPCSEYMFLDDTACNLASMNLVKFDTAADRRTLLRVPYPRPRIREHRRPSDAQWNSLRLADGDGVDWSSHSHHGWRGLRNVSGTRG
jgi:ribonucleoside-diphosphate reductase alpha chain